MSEPVFKAHLEQAVSAGLTVDVPPSLIDAIAERVAELLEARRPTGPEPWIGVEAAAEHLNCRPQRIYNLIGQGELPHRKDGRRLLFRRSDLDAWLDGRASA